MMHIHLHNLRFRSFHGLYEEEKLLGNEYEVNLDVSYESEIMPVTDIDNSIDYTTLYQLVKQRMSEPTPLLETIVSKIAMDIQKEFRLASKISISVKKLSPPINNFEGSVGVSFEWNK